MQTQTRLPKFRRRPEQLGNRKLTTLSLEIIALIERYKLLPSSLIVLLLGRDRSTVYRQLQFLWEHDWISRFAFPRIGNPTEGHYYIENRRALDLLVEQGVAEQSALDHDKVRYHREHPYTDIQDPKTAAKSQGRLLYANHELMISRFHAMLELGCKRSRGAVELAAWQQGPQLWDTVVVPKFHYDGEGGHDLETTETLPHRPDGFFSLRYPNRPEDEQLVHYFYEADRATTNTTKFNKKLRAHFHYISKQKKHVEKYGVNRIRAVLIETISHRWADTLYQAARHLVVSGMKPSPLFWFTSAELYSDLVISKKRRKDGMEYKNNRAIPYYLEHPEDLLYKAWWSSPAIDRFLISLFDLSHFKH